MADGHFQFDKVEIFHGADTPKPHILFDRIAI